MLISFNASQGYTYKTLKASGANFSLKADDYFNYKDHTHVGTFKTLGDWSNTHNEFSTWVYLNALVSLTSNFEIYLSSIIKLSLDSDPGTIIGASKSVDGIFLKKYKKHKIDHSEYVTGCVKGTWLSRINNLEKIFNTTFPIIRNNLRHLERLRNTRNNVAHAFGHSIKDTENYEIVNKYALPRMTVERLIKYQILIFKIVETIDEYLLKNHIGQYQLILYYYLWKKEKKKKRKKEKKKKRKPTLLMNYKFNILAVIFKEIWDNIERYLLKENSHMNLPPSMNIFKSKYFFIELYYFLSF